MITRYLSPVIDCHVHAVPQDLLTECTAREIDGVSAVRSDDGYRVWMPGYRQPKILRPGMTAAGRRATWARERGITAQIVAPWLDIQPTEAMPKAAVRSWARRLNDALAAECSGDAVLPANRALGTVAFTDYAATDLEEAVTRGGMAGLIMSTCPAGLSGLDDPALESVWATAEGLGVPVMLHPPTDGPSRCLPGGTEFSNTFGRLVDTTFAVAALLLAGVLDHHPLLRLVVVHGRGFLPYQSGRLDGGHRADALARRVIARERPSDYMTDLYFDTVAMKPAAIRFLAESVGPKRVLLGSDYPFPIGDQESVDTVRAAGLSEEDTTAVLCGNSESLFGVLS